MLIHSSSHDVRDAMIEASRIAGQLGATRLPDVVHAHDPSDTTIVRCLDALDAGRAEREQRLAQVDVYTAWLRANREELDRELERAIKRGCKDTSQWLLDRYFEVAGVRL